MSKAKELDQFYTTPEVAILCVDKLRSFLGGEYDLSTTRFLEPSAGLGAFLDALDQCGYSWVAGDLDPHHDGVVQQDFLGDYDWGLSRDDIVIGNPPFGKRSVLAVNFINKGLELADTVAFILPIQFNKYLTQKRINKDARLVYSDILNPESFTFNGKPYKVRSVFQVWTLREDLGENIRILQAPPTKHSDFHMEYYNCVPEKLHLFDQQWDFAILRQGWDNFVPQELDDYSGLSKKKQWMFFRADDNKVLNNLKSIDYNKLAEKNTSVRGFGKADIVEEYMKLYG